MRKAATFELFEDKLGELVESFRRNQAHLRSSAYAESSLRNDFLLPFWRALGWDVENEDGLLQPLREVEVESRVDVAGKNKRADYLFRTDGIERFVCEAKKPSEDLSPKHAYQAQRYAFNLKLLVATLTKVRRLASTWLEAVQNKTDPGTRARRGISLSTWQPHEISGTSFRVSRSERALLTDTLQVCRSER